MYFDLIEKDKYDWINLNDLWTLEWSQLPDFIKVSNAVYVCRCIITGKCYVGETKMEVAVRWSGNGLSHVNAFYNGARNIIYNAIRKYSPNQFEVTVVESGFESDQSRKSAESEWIKKFHAFKSDWGYNMNLGGSNTSHLNDPKVKLKALESERNHYGGVLHTQLDGYQEHRMNLDKERNGGVMGCHKSEARKKATETDKANHGGKLACHSDAVFDEKRRRGNGDCMYQCHTPEAIAKVFTPERNAKRGLTLSINKIFISISRNIEYLKSQGGSLNIDDYYHKSLIDMDRHISRVRDKLKYLVNDPRWTDEMTLIFSKYIKSDLTDHQIN